MSSKPHFLGASDDIVLVSNMSTIQQQEVIVFPIMYIFIYIYAYIYLYKLYLHQV